MSIYIGLFRSAVVSALAIAALAPAVSMATTQVSSVTIVSISIYAGSSGSGAVVVFTPAVPGLLGCTNTTGNIVWIDFSSTAPPTGANLYATVLAAHLANQKVGFGVDVCGDNGNFPQVYRVDVS